MRIWCIVFEIWTKVVSGGPKNCAYLKNTSIQYYSGLQGGNLIWVITLQQLTNRNAWEFTNIKHHVKNLKPSKRTFRVELGQSTDFVKLKTENPEIKITNQNYFCHYECATHKLLETVSPSLVRQIYCPCVMIVNKLQALPEKQELNKIRGRGTSTRKYGEQFSK